MASQSLPGSHNPFRRKGSTSTTKPAADVFATDPADVSSSLFSRQRPPASSLDFARALESLPKTDAPPPNTTFQKKKPVKKVRVQSPPPSSPESTSAEHTYPKYPLPPRDDDYESSSSDSVSVNGDREDPFQHEAPPIPQEMAIVEGSLDSFNSRFPPTYTGRVGGGPPSNPFQQTLEDMEPAAAEGSQATNEQNASAGKAGLDVEAFKKLLLTGQGPVLNTAPSAATGHGTGIAGDGGSITETSSISKQSISEAAHLLQDTPRTSHEISEPDADMDKRDKGPAPPPQRSGSRKKPPPPPPATRHGKLIKVELKDKDARAQAERRSSTGQSVGSPTSPRRSSSTSPTDVNKPLPPAPHRSEDGVKNSIFDTEAAGKIPEIDVDPDADIVPPPRPPTPPNASHSASTPVPNPSSTLRKPAPPPRRQGHARGESKTTVVDTSDELASTPPRSSLESQRSRSSSLRVSLAGPAPPPPRRAASHRQSPSFSSPASFHQTSPSYPFPATSGSPGSSDQTAPYHQTDASSSSTSLSAPPTGLGATGVAKSAPAPPPPPPPQRHTSVRKAGSTRPVATEPTPRRSSGGSVPPPPPPRTRGSSKGSMDGPAGLGRADSVRGRSESAVPEEFEAGPDTAASDEALKAMLADLDALQREVDAARAAAGGE